MQGGERYCLWLPELDAAAVASSPELAARAARVASARERRGTWRAQGSAQTPWRFETTWRPQSRFAALSRFPRPFGEFLCLAAYEPDVVVTDSVLVVDSQSLSVFAILSSRVFAVWHRAVSPGAESGQRVSVPVTYNNFPFPDLSRRDKDALEDAAELILTARMSVPHEGLSDLYDPDRMSDQLRRAHRENDRIVLGVLGLPADATDEAITDALFERHDHLSSVA